MQSYIITKTPLCTKNEPSVNPTLINHANKVHELERGLLGLIGVLAPSEFNSKVDSISHYRKSTKLQYHMQITIRHHVLGSVTYYLFHSVSLWTSIHSLRRWKLEPFKTIILFLSYKSFYCFFNWHILAFQEHNVKFH